MRGWLGLFLLLFLCPTPTSGQEFIRGDGNGDGVVNIGDPTFNLSYLFIAGPSVCLDAQDTNDDGAIDLSDPIYGLAHLVNSGSPPPSPFPNCGEDPTADPLGCATPPACVAVAEAPLLVVLMDFADSNMESILPDPETAWSDLVFGQAQSQGNGFWSEVSGGQLHLLPAIEGFGTANNGVVRVSLAVPRPVLADGRLVVQDQTWIPDSLDMASGFIQFEDYDVNGDGVIQNEELSILLVLNISFQNISGAGAAANIPINHVVNGVGPTIEKFTRTLHTYTSIGVNMHELAHHILELKHFAGPTHHGLMGLGAYGEDPVITLLHDPSSHWGTRPTHLTGFQKVQAGFVEPTLLTETALNVELHSPHATGYNVIQIPVVDGFLYLENRTAEGYDASIPFCESHTGGLFPTDHSQYLQGLSVGDIEFRRTEFSYDIRARDICNIYSLAGYTDEFSVGGYTITNISAAGPTMTFDLIKNNVTPAIESYKWRYWVIDPIYAGYRMRHYVTAQEGMITDIDFSEFPSGDDPNGFFTMNLASFFNTGDERSVNAEATWSSSSDYVQITQSVFTNPGCPRSDAFIRIQLVESAPYEDNVVVTVTHDGFESFFRLMNIPSF